jgi:hypothetical protein
VPKLFPVMVTKVPTGPAVGLMFVILGVIVKTGPPILDTPETTRETATMLYADRLPGTIATTLVSLQLVTVAATEPIITELVPWVSPKPVPVMVTELPAGPEVGLRPEMTGPMNGLTVKATPLLATPPTVTTTLPEVAPFGTSIEIEVVLQLLGAARVPLKVTVLVPWVAPKLPPVIVTNEPAEPVVGLRLVIVGVGVIEKLTWLLASPKTTT